MSRRLPKLFVEAYLQDKGITKDTIQVSDPDENPIGKIDAGKIVEALQISGDSLDLKTDEGRKGAELKHRINARSIVVIILAVPMFITPLWLMLILSLPTFNIKSYSERMQYALLGALASDIMGLCYIVTRDLFPQGGKKSDDDTK